MSTKTTPLHTKLATTSASNLSTVEAELRSHAGPGAECLATLAVQVYWHQPSDGDPYLVVEVDSNDTDTEFRVYVDDAPIFTGWSV